MQPDETGHWWNHGHAVPETPLKQARKASAKLRKYLKQRTVLQDDLEISCRNVVAPVGGRPAGERELSIDYIYGNEILENLGERLRELFCKHQPNYDNMTPWLIYKDPYQRQGSQAFRQGFGQL